jgi:tetratricopeptide (TPR) repeat protein
MYGLSDQQELVCAMKCLADMLDTLEDVLKKTPTLGQLGGLTHAKVFCLRGGLYYFMRNGRSALKDWTKAIALDPSLAVARMARLHHWMSTKMKTNLDLYAEAATFLGLVHEDYMELDVIYGILALTTFADPRLGTFADAMEYYKKNLQATSRRVELYCPRFMPNDILYHVRLIMNKAYEDLVHSDDAKRRKQLDGGMTVARAMVAAWYLRTGGQDPAQSMPQLQQDQRKGQHQ